jgi:hypothetical protein
MLYLSHLWPGTEACEPGALCVYSGAVPQSSRGLSLILRHREEEGCSRSWR